MFANLRMTLTNYARYKGGRGLFSFLMHRITGLGILIFLSFHIVETSLVYFAPLSYNRVVGIFHSPLFMLGEVVLVFCVIFHGVNGLRIAFFDIFKPKFWESHIANNSFLITLIIAISIWLPLAVVMVNKFMKFYLFLIRNN